MIENGNACFFVFFNNIYVNIIFLLSTSLLNRLSAFYIAKEEFIEILKVIIF